MGTGANQWVNRKAIVPMDDTERQQMLTMFPELTDDQLTALRAAGSNLTPKQRRVIAYRLAGKTAAEAGRLAGYESKGSALRGASHRAVRQSTHGLAYMRALADAVGLSDSRLMERLHQGMNAMRYELHQASGNVVEVGPDWKTRLEFAKLALQAKGRMPDPKLELTGKDGGAIVVRHTPSLAD